MKNIPFIILLCLFSCVTNSEKAKKLKTQENETSLYDLSYLELLEQNKNFRPINIDSLRTTKIQAELFNETIAYLDLDSISHKNLKSQFNTDKPVVEIKVADSIKKKLGHSSRKLEVLDFFSEPFSVSSSQKFLLFETHHRLGFSDGAIFFSGNAKGSWKLDSLVVLNNYRGGGRFPNNLEQKSSR